MPDIGSDIAQAEYIEQQKFERLATGDDLSNELIQIEDDLLRAVRTRDVQLIGAMVLSVFEAWCKREADDEVFGSCINKSYSSAKMAAAIAMLRHVESIPPKF